VSTLVQDQVTSELLLVMMNLRHLKDSFNEDRLDCTVYNVRKVQWISQPDDEIIDQFLAKPNQMYKKTRQLKIY